MQKNHVIAFQIDSRISEAETWRPTVLLSLLQLQGVCSYAYTNGYSVNLIVPQKDNDLQEIESQIISENSIDGLILTGWRDLSETEIRQLLAKLDKCNVPVVSLDYKIYELGYPSVSVNLRTGIKKACQRIWELGHRNVCYIGGKKNVNPQQFPQRFNIISDELAEWGVRLFHDKEKDVYSEIDAYRKTTEILTPNHERPTCIIYHGDHLAMAGIKAIIDLKLRVPDNISVIGIDNAPYSASSPVPLATIDQKHFQQGVILAKQLLDKIENPQTPIPSISVIESEFIERESLGPIVK
ncbi:MAG: substrate-binding domain-containing protein [Victivallaceae bacterium]